MKNIESFIERIAAVNSGFEEAGMQRSKNWNGEESGLFLSRFKDVNDGLVATIKALSEIEEQLNKD